MDKMLRLFIQLFAEEESETTDLPEEEETEELEEEFSDEEETETEPVEEPTEEPEKVKTFTQDELNKIVEDRIKRERKSLDRDYKDKLSKYEELAYLTKEGLKVENYDDALVRAREFYGKQGIKYAPTNNEDEQILANAYTSRIIEESDSIEDIQAAADKLIAKGVNISNKEKLVLQGLVDEMESRKRAIDLKALGVKEEVYNSDSFKKFEKKFAKDTPISEIYNMYRLETKSSKKLDNPGSMKSVPTKSKKSFITEAEYDKMSSKEIEANMDLIKESMARW